MPQFIEKINGCTKKDLLDLNEKYPTGTIVCGEFSNFSDLTPFPQEITGRILVKDKLHFYGRDWEDVADGTLSKLPLRLDSDLRELSLEQIDDLELLPCPDPKTGNKFNELKTLSVRFTGIHKFDLSIAPKLESFHTMTLSYFDSSENLHLKKVIFERFRQMGDREDPLRDWHSNGYIAPWQIKKVEFNMNKFMVYIMALNDIIRKEKNPVKLLKILDVYREFFNDLNNYCITDKNIYDSYDIKSSNHHSGNNILKKIGNIMADFAQSEYISKKEKFEKSFNIVEDMVNLVAEKQNSQIER